MSRRGLIIIAVVAGLLLASPFVIGMINESTVRNGVERYSNRATVAASVESFDRGWISSQARMRFGLDPDYLENLDELTGGAMLSLLGGLSLPVIADFEHGPILRNPEIGFGTASIHAYIDPESQLAQTAQLLLGMPYVVDFKGRGSFGLGFDYAGDIPPAEMNFGDFILESTGAGFSGSFGGGKKYFTGELEQLSVQSLFANAIVEAVTMTSDMHSSGNGELPLGDAELVIGRVAISDPLQGAESSFTANGMRISTSVRENADDGFVDVGLIYALDALSVGSDLTIGRAQLGMRLEHLDADATTELYRFAETGNLTGDPAELQAQMMPILSRLLAGQPVLLLEPMNFSMPEGEVTGKLTVTLDPIALAPGTVLDEAALALALQSAGVALDLTASKRVVQRLAEEYLLAQMPAAIDLGIQGQPPIPQEQLEAQAEVQAGLVLLLLSAQGLIVDSGENWTTTLSLENGVPTANGQPIALGL